MAGGVDVIMMLLVTMVFVAIVAVGVWPVLKDLPRDDGKTPDAEPERPAAAPEPSSLEGALVASLLSHEITAGQYRRAMGRLAERDDDVHPLTVPPEGGVGHE